MRNIRLSDASASRRANAPLIQLVLVAGLVLTTAPAAFAAPAATLQVHGVLRATGGGPASDGDYLMTFALYAKKSGGSAVWQEPPTIVTIANGSFAHTLGATKSLSPAVFAGGAAWLGVTIGKNPELSRSPLTAVAWSHMAHRALDVSCTGCVSASELKLDGDLDLGAHGLKAGKLTASAIVASSVTAASFVGDGSKLTGIKSPAGVCAKKGEVVRGIGADGSLICIAAVTGTDLPADGLGKVSNKLLTNVFNDAVAAAKVPVPIPDNNPQGVDLTIDVPDLGIARKLTVDVKLTNSDVSKVSVWLFDPNLTKYVVHDKTGSGKALQLTVPPGKLVSGNLDTWLGKNAKGTWRLRVIDSAFATNKDDGAVQAFSITIQTLSTKKVAASGNLVVHGVTDLKGGSRMQRAAAHPGKCIASEFGRFYANTKDMTVYICNGLSWRPISIAEPPKIPPKNCKEILAADKNAKSGVYTIKPAGLTGAALKVYCDMKYDGGGWTVLAYAPNRTRGLTYSISKDTGTVGDLTKGWHQIATAKKLSALTFTHFRGRYGYVETQSGLAQTGKVFDVWVDYVAKWGTKSVGDLKASNFASNWTVKTIGGATCTAWYSLFSLFWDSLASSAKGGKGGHNYCGFYSPGTKSEGWCAQAYKVNSCNRGGHAKFTWAWYMVR